MEESKSYIKPIGRTSLTKEVVNELTELIMKGVWSPGDSLPSEKELAASFGVGRSTIREALQSLVVIGVLETRKGGSSIVREPTTELLSGAFRWGLLLSHRNLDDLTEVRLHVEVECAGLAAERHTDEDIIGMDETLQVQTAARNDDARFMEQDNQFHRQVAEAAKNLIFVNLTSTIQSLVRLWYPSVYKSPATKERTIEEHSAILNAIRVSDREMAQAAMRRHVMDAADRLNKVLSLR